MEQGGISRNPNRELPPITRPYLSTVYRSRDTKKNNPLKFALSVPIWSGEKDSSDRRVAAVMMMSVDLKQMSPILSRASS
ncbi:MAG: hypothetical protein QM811_23745 [Pirellulales bacterium]